MILQVTMYLIIGLLSSLLVGRGANGDITMSPTNKAVLNGTVNVTISCAFTSIGWSYRYVPVGSASSPVIIAVDNTVFQQQQFYAVQRPGSNQVNLIILSATPSRAGTYFCNELPSQTASAQLIVINSDPVCNMTPNAPTELQYNQAVQMTCSITYTANLYVSVDMTWSNGGLVSNAPPQTTTSANLTTATSTITQTPGYSSLFPVYRCNTTFKISGNPTGSADNAPDYSKSTQLNSPIPVISFPISMEPLFGPVAGGTKITITGPSPSDYPPKNSGSYTPDLGDAINVYIGSYLSATSLFKVNASSTVSLVAVTPNTTDASIGQPLPVIIEFSSAPVNTTLFNVTFNKTFTYRPNPNITSLYPNRFIVNGGTLLDVTGHSLSSVYKPIIQLTVVIYRANENGSTLAKSTTATFGVCKVPPGNDTYMQCQMPPLNLSDDLLAILNSGYNTNTIRIKRQIQPSVLTVPGPNGTDSADIYLGFILDGYKEYENINDAFPDTQFIFYSAPEINSSGELIQFDPSEDELIYVKGRYMLRGCLKRDYVVHIGSQTCTISDLHDNQLSCRPPKAKPAIPMNDTIYCHQHLSIAIAVGYKQYQYACLTYKDTKNVALIVGLTVGLVGFAIFLSILTVCIVRRRSREISQDTHSHRHSGGPELRHRHEQPESQQKVNIICRIQNMMTLYRPDDYYESALPLEQQPGYDHRIEEYGYEVKPNDGYLTSSDIDLQGSRM